MSQSRPRILIRTILQVGTDLLSLVLLAFRSHARLAAENLFLRKQLALYLEQQAKPRRADDATRITQFRMVVPGDQAHRFVIHGRDTICSEGVDRTLAAMGLTVLKAPMRAPTANAFCERLVGTMRRECLDFVILFVLRLKTRTVEIAGITCQSKIGGLPRRTAPSDKDPP